MNTKTNAPAAVAQLDKGADKSPKQPTVQTVQANKPADHAAPANSKGNQAMAKTEFDDKRYAELHAKSATELGLNDTEHDEYVKLMGQRRAAVAAKRKELETLVDAFLKSPITFAVFYKAVVEKDDGKRAEITSLFTPKQIAAAAAKLANEPAVEGATTPAKVTRTQTVKSEADLVIHLTAERGRGLRITKADLLAGKWGTYATKSLKDLTGKDEAAFVAGLKGKNALKNDFEELYKNDTAFQAAVAKLYSHNKTKALPPAPKTA